jgi:hypothetical protein
MPKYTEHPSVPKVLQEALKDYPELIADLQSSLNRGGMWPGITKTERTDELEAAMWRLEGDLSHYIALAAEEVKAAEALGDVEAIAKAKAKKMLMHGCRCDIGWPELAEFFRWGKD